MATRRTTRRGPDGNPRSTTASQRATLRREPALVGALLEGARVVTSGRAGRAVEPEVWHAAVGARIASRTTPGRLQRGTLEVRVASAVWAQELSFLKDDLVTRLRAAGIKVTALSFRVQAPARGPTPAVAARRPPAPLPADMQQRLKQVDDPELRRVIAEAAGHALANERPPISPRPSAPAPRSAAPRSDPSGQTAATPRATRRRKS